MGFINVVKVDGKYVPETKAQDMPKSSKTTGRFNHSTESTPAYIGRMAYKPVSSTISTLGGMPADLWNLLAGATGVPTAPEPYTSAGIKKTITSPLGDLLFGQGSQEPQPGIIEGITDKASQWAPYTIGGAGLAVAKGLPALGKLGAGLLTNLLQGTTGQGIKELGGGETSQFIGEAATGAIAPIAGKLLGSGVKRATTRIAENLTENEAKTWGRLDKAASEVGRVEVKSFEKSLMDLDIKAVENIAGSNRKPITQLINEIENGIQNSTTKATSLVGTRKKINGLLSTTKDGSARNVLRELKNSVDEQLGRHIGSLQLDAAKATTIKKQFMESDAYKKFIDTTSKKYSPQGIEAAGKVLERIAPYGFGYKALMLKNPFMLIGIPVFKGAQRIAKNAALMFKDPLILKEGLKALNTIGKRSAIISTAKYAKNQPDPKLSNKFIKWKEL